jgi:hypothetical protein
MKRFVFILTIFTLAMVGTARVYSQTGEPPGLDLPIDGSATADSATATAETSVEASPSLVVSETESVTTQEAIDDAETGTEIIILAILSLVGGLGLFSIKKYFDSKKFSI